MPDGCPALPLNPVRAKEATMKHLLVALVVVTGMVAGVGVAGATAPSAASPDAIALQLDGLQDFVERLDQFLESVADLLQTLQQLFGGSEG